MVANRLGSSRYFDSRGGLQASGTKFSRDPKTRTLVIARRIVVIDRSRGVCGESDVGNKKLLAAVVAVSGAFATELKYRLLR